MVSTGIQPISQKRLRKMQSVIWVMVIIRALSGFKNFRNIRKPLRAVLIIVAQKRKAVTIRKKVSTFFFFR